MFCSFNQLFLCCETQQHNLVTPITTLRCISRSRWRRARVMLTLTAAASFSASLQPTAFTILDNAGSDCLELIGRSRVRHEGHVPSFDSLERMLSAARTRHRNLGAQCNELEKPATAWCASELKASRSRSCARRTKSSKCSHSCGAILKCCGIPAGQRPLWQRAIRSQ